MEYSSVFALPVIFRFLSLHNVFEGAALFPAGNNSNPVSRPVRAGLGKGKHSAV